MAAAIVRGGVHAVLRNRCVSTVSAARHFSSVGNDVYDVVVVGAGVVGSTLACKLGECECTSCSQYDVRLAHLVLNPCFSFNTKLCWQTSGTSGPSEANSCATDKRGSR